MPSSHRRHLDLALRLILLGAFLGTPSSVAAAPRFVPSVGVSPTSGPAGSGATVSGSGFTPGFNAEIRWDGSTIDSFTMPGSGTFSRPITIPSGAAPGSHSIFVCNYCGGGEFEESAGASFTVVSLATPTATLPPPTPTPIPVCTDLGLGPEGQVLDFETDPFRSSARPGFLSFAAPDLYIEAEVVIPSVRVRSGTRGAQSLEGMEFGSALHPIRIQLAEPAQAIGMFVGMEAAPYTRGMITATLTVHGYRSGEGPLVPLGNDSVSFFAAPTDLRHCLAFEAAPSDVIAWAFVEYTDSFGTSIAEPRLIDDLTVVPSEIDFPPDLPPVVEITEPGDGARIVEGDVNLRATIIEDRGLRSALYRVNGVDTLAGEAPSATDPTLYTLAANFSSTLLRPYQPNTITVRANDLAYQVGEDTITLVYEPPFDVQVLGIEVTQGVRGAVPFRVPPNGALSLGTEFGVHVADRQTVVRVYPWIDFGFETDAGVPLTAQLRGFRGDDELPGSPLISRNLAIPIASGRTLQEMRANEGMSWNFVLPPSWVRQGAITLVAEVNPEGPMHVEECEGCAENNAASLNGVLFQIVQTQDVDVRIYSADMHWRDAEGAVVHFEPTLSEIAEALRWWISVWPIATFAGGDSGVMRTSIRYTGISQNPDDSRADPPIPGAPQWDNQVYLDENQDVIPAGDASNPYAYIPLLFSPRSWIGCEGMAGIGHPPLFHAGACGPTVAQEATHSIGSTHACPEVPCAHDEEEGGSIDPAYPGPHGEVEPHAYGFDVFNMRAVPPENDSGHVHDFMSYGGNFWVSLYTWNAVADAFDAPEIVAQPAPAVALASYRAEPSPGLAPQSGAPLTTLLRISGRIGPEGAVTLDPSFLVSAPGPSAGSGPHRLELQDREGTVLFSTRFETVARTHAAAGAPADFYLVAPQLEGVRDLVLFRDDVELARFPVSSRAPTIEIVEPVPGARWPAEGEGSVSWEASDPNRNDALAYRVELSPDGARWFTLASGLTDDKVILDLSTIPGGGDGLTLRVQASDGFNIGTAEVAPLIVESSPPQAFVLQPAHGAFFGSGTIISLLGQGFDWSDGPLPDEALSWELDGVEVGGGSALEIAAPEVGEHTVTLRVTNAAGSARTMEVRVTVGEDLDYDGLSDEWELANGLDPTDPTDAALDADGDALAAWQEQSRGTDPARADTDGDGLDDAAELASGSDPVDPAVAVAEGRHGEAHTPLPVTDGARSPQEARTLDVWVLRGAVLIALVLSAAAAGAAAIVARRRRAAGRPRQD